jgi:L-ascorbate metabolism protein UlaG (beta-lactamase superfamily)
VKLTHFGHASVLVETDDGRRSLFDPGTYSSGFESLTALDLILLTHAHPDHVDAERLAALRKMNEQAVLIATAEAAVAAGDSRPEDRIVDGVAPFTAAGVKIQPTGGTHAIIHPDLPQVDNSGFILDDLVWHPGDALDAESRTVDVLLLPVGGPWMKISEAIDFARRVAPRVIVPIHQGGLAEVHRQLHYGLLRNLVSSSEVVVLEEGIPRDI